jgi:hypothetical protein
MLAVALVGSIYAHCAGPSCMCRGLTQEEKAYLRGRLLQLIPQHDNQVQSCSLLLLSTAYLFYYPALHKCMIQSA